jgi:hypothetical protein
MVAHLVKTVPSRPPINGPEARLLELFLRSYRPRLRPDERLTIFREPRIESGFPDLVMVVSRAGIELPELGSLRLSVLKLLHFLHLTGPVATDDLVSRRGRAVVAELESLNTSRLIVRTPDGWRARSLGAIFGAREIVAVEAKISGWSSALRQAELNTWFASRSYILVPAAPRSARFFETARANQVGIVLQRDKPSVLLKSPRQPLPGSYVSWMLASWATTHPVPRPNGDAAVYA